MMSRHYCTVLFGAHIVELTIHVGAAAKLKLWDSKSLKLIQGKSCVEFVISQPSLYTHTS